MKKLIKKFPLLLGAARWYRDMGVAKRPAVETPFGFRFVGLEAMQKGEFEVEEVTLFRRLLTQNEVFINIGANTGYYCCFALQSKKEVVAFEPSDMNLKALFRNVKENGWEKGIEVFPLALSENCGLATFYGTGLLGSLVKGWSNNPDQISRTVPLNTLDRILGGHFEEKRCLIVMDVEGAELSVLKGGGEILSQEPKPLWMVEANIGVHFVGTKNQSNPDVIPLFEKFWEKGYVAWTATEVPRRVPKEEVEKVIATGEDTLKTHNFVFADPAIDLNGIASQ